MAAAGSGMRQGQRGERLVALFVAAWLAFHPPLVTLFGVKATLFGLPVLYVYLFAVWGAVIALTALIVGREEEDGALGTRAGEARAGEAGEREG